MPSISADQFERIRVTALGGAVSNAPVSAGRAAWVSSEGLLVAATTSARTSHDIAERPRRAADPTGVGLAAEAVVDDFLAGGELEKLGGKALRWRPRVGEQPGWDIDYQDPDGELNAVAVKGTTAVRFASIEITANEWRAASELSHRSSSAPSRV